MSTVQKFVPQFHLQSQNHWLNRIAEKSLDHTDSYPLVGAQSRPTVTNHICNTTVKNHRCSSTATNHIHFSSELIISITTETGEDNTYITNMAVASFAYNQCVCQILSILLPTTNMTF